MKVTLATPPVLLKSDTTKKLIVYLLVSVKAINTVLVQEERSDQRPIYFVSQIIQDSETGYQVMEKVALALVNVACRLHQYF